MARFLNLEEIEVTAFCEVNERQIGNRISGIPVLGQEAVAERNGETILIGAVGQPGARARIRHLAEDAGYVEGDDFFCVA
jgi:hypothetical protein